MSLNILSVLSDVNASGVILQGAVIVTFDQEIDVTTYTENSLLLSAPPETPAIAPGGLVGAVTPAGGTDYVAGTFSFALNSLPQSQRFEEIEDTFTWKHLVMGGGMRLQSSETSTEHQNTIF